MALTCPNTSSSAWQNLENKVGLVEAYRIYNRLDFEVPDFVFTTPQEVEDYIKTFPEITFRNGLLYIKTGGSLVEYNNNISSVTEKVAKINQAYHNLVIIDAHEIPQTEKVVTSKYNIGRTKAHFVDILPQSLEEHYSVYNDYDSELEPPLAKEIEVENIKETILLKDKRGKTWQDLFEDIFNNSEEDVSSQSVIRRLFRDGYIDESSPNYELAKQLTGLDFNVHFVKDINKLYNLNERKRPQDPWVEVYAFLKNGKEVILDVEQIANFDNEFFVDTFLHELIHAYTVREYDVNPIFKEKIKTLFVDAKENSNGSTLYGYKNPKEFMAEIMTNVKFAEHVRKGPNGKNFLEKFIDLIVRFIFRRYKKYEGKKGMDIYHETVVAVTELIVGKNQIEGGIENGIIEDVDTEVYPREVESEEEFKTNLNKKYNIKESKSTLGSLYEKAINELQNKANIYKSGKKGTTHRQEVLEELISEMKQYDKNPAIALDMFQDYVYRQAKEIEASYMESDRKRTEGNPDAFTIQQLDRWSDYIQGYDSIEDLISFARGMEIQYSSDKEINKAKTLLDNEKLKEIVAIFKTIKNAYITEGRKLIARELTPYSKHIEAEYKDLYERKYNKLSDTYKNITSKDEYINEQIGLHIDEIQEATEKALNEQLVLASDDIGFMRRWLGSLPDSKDMVVAAIADVLIETDRKWREQILPLKAEMIDKLRALENISKGTGFTGNIRDTYNFMLELDSYGIYTGHIIDIYKSEMWEDRERALDNVRKSGATYEEIQTARQKWNKENFPIDWIKLKKERKKYYQQLYKDGLIRRIELLKLQALDWDQKPDTVINNQELLDKIYDWNKEHIKLYRTPVEKWINPQWLELVELAGGDTSASLDAQLQAVKDNTTKNAQIDFYNFIRNTLDSVQPRVPYQNRLYTRLPGQLKGLNERIKSGDNSVKDLVGYSLSNTFDIMSDDDTRGETFTDETGKEQHFIPVYYTGNIKKKYENQYNEFDADKIKEIEKNYTLDYEKLDSTLQDTLTLEEYAKNRFIKDNANNDQSYDLASIYFNYFSSAINYSEKKEVLPMLEMAKTLVEERDYAVTDWKGNIKQNKGVTEIKAKDKVQLPKQLNDILESILYGITEVDAGKLFGKIDINKGVKALNRFTSLNLLGLNFVQGFHNIALGSTMQFIESFGGRFYGKKDLLKANLYYWKNIGGVLNDIGTRYPKSVINLLNQEFDTLNEYYGGEFRKNSKFRQLLSSNTLLFTTHIGEHEMQTKVLLAMLNKIQAKNGDKILGTMLDCAKVKDGKLIFEGTNGEEVTNFDSNQRSALEKKAKFILSRMHGEYSKLGQPAAQREALGKLGRMFRKFIVPGFDRRYSSKYVNNRIGDYDEGMYRTTAKFLYSLRKDLLHLRFAVVSEDWNNLRDYEKSNIKKTGVEVLFLVSTLILASMMTKLDADDDDESWITSFMAYQALRYRAELWFFLNPNESMKILRSPAAAMSMLENTIKLVGQLSYPIFEGEWDFERYERGNWKGQYKITKTIIDYIPAYKQIYRLRDVGDLSNWLK